MCVSTTIQSKTYSISICAGGHATLSLGRVAIHLEIDELKSLVKAAGEILEEWDERDQPARAGDELHVH